MHADDSFITNVFLSGREACISDLYASAIAQDVATDSLRNVMPLNASGCERVHAEVTDKLVCQSEGRI